MTADISSCSYVPGTWFDSVNVYSSTLNVIKIINE